MSIYIIKSKEQSLHDFYVGSCEDMRSREVKHKSVCNNENSPEYNYKVYKFIRANGGWDNFIMEQIDTCDVERLFIVEQEYIDKLNPNLNTRRAYRSKECKREYDNQDKKKWNDNNKEYRKEYKKEHYEKNKDIILEKSKEYYHKNKDRINEKFTCECGGRYTKSNKLQHLRTKIHKSFIENE